jgi:hypothetical protein
MKTQQFGIIIPIALVILGLIRILSVLSTGKDKIVSNINCGQDSSFCAKNRESITFILGEDKEEDNPFYSEATKYFLNNADAKTDRLVNECRSISEVLDYLETHRTEKRLPWGLINLVSHGNQWLGLSVKVTPNSLRATPDLIKDYIENDSLPHLSEGIIDSQSEIFIHACGVGNNERLPDAISEAFSCSSERPKVKASKLFELYTSVTKVGNVIESERYYAEVQFITYKKGYEPEKSVIVNLLKRKYPNNEIDFYDALSRKFPRYSGDTYHYSFEVPVKWVIPYPDSDSLPDLSTKERQEEWINRQKEITETLSQLEIPQDQFNWWFREVSVNNEDGTSSPAVWLKGYCTILCVIKPLTEEGPVEGILRKPFIPDPNDIRYFYFL